MKKQIKAYKKWALLALTEDPLFEVLNKEGQIYNIHDVVQLLKKKQAFKDVKIWRCTFGFIETLRFNSGNESWADFAKQVMTPEFYPHRGNKLVALYCQAGYANFMMRAWESLQLLDLKQSMRLYNSPELRREVTRLEEKYPFEQRKHLLLAIAVHLVQDTMDDLIVTSDSETDSSSSLSSSTTSSSDDDDEDDARKVTKRINRKRPLPCPLVLSPSKKCKMTIENV